MQPVSDSAGRGVEVRHRVAEFSENWVIHEGQVPQAAWHSRAVDHLLSLLVAWRRRTDADAFVYRDLAVRVRADRPSVGFDPDVCIVSPAPPELGELDSLKLWHPEHHVPALTFEVVSKNHPTKDYVEIPDKCAAAGVGELVIFDPLRCGPRAVGGRHLLQVWRRAGDGGFERVYANDGPFECATVKAWLLPSADRKELDLSDDREGGALWLTTEAAERAAKETERAAKEAALLRVAELEAELARKR